MFPHLTRAELLASQSRHAPAIEEYRRHLLDRPDDPQAHAHLALSLAALEDFPQATHHAQQAVALAPDEGFPHYVLASVFAQRNRLADARRAIDEAIRLEPYVPHFFRIRGLVSAEEYKWADALRDADAGLEIDPEDTDCLNLRARCLAKLGRKLEARESLATALARDPDDPLTHANQGWTKLQQGQTREAMESFREALRLDPELDWARAGIVEALKARNPVYRVFLGYVFWMSRLSPRAQWGIIIGGYFAFRAVGSLARAHPEWSPYLQPLLWLYIAFALLTWLATPLFDLLLRTNRFGRYALSRDQTRGANLFGGLMLVAVGLLAAGLWHDSGLCLVGAIIVGLLLLPASAIYRCETGWPRLTMAGATALLLVVGVAGLFREGLATLFIFGIIGSQLLANFLAQARVRK